MSDHAFDAAAGLETELRQLRRLAAARVAADHDDAMRRYRCEQLVPRRGDRQRLRILEPVARRSPSGDDLLARAAHKRPTSAQRALASRPQAARSQSARPRSTDASSSLDETWSSAPD